MAQFIGYNKDILRYVNGIPQNKLININLKELQLNQKNALNKNLVNRNNQITLHQLRQKQLIDPFEIIRIKKIQNQNKNILDKNKNEINLKYGEVINRLKTGLTHKSNYAKFDYNYYLNNVKNYPNRWKSIITPTGSTFREVATFRPFRSQYQRREPYDRVTISFDANKIPTSYKEQQIQYRSSGDQYPERKQRIDFTSNGKVLNAFQYNRNGQTTQRELYNFNNGSFTVREKNYTQQIKYNNALKSNLTVRGIIRQYKNGTYFADTMNGTLRVTKDSSGKYHYVDPQKAINSIRNNFPTQFNAEVLPIMKSKLGLSNNKIDSLKIDLKAYNNKNIIKLKTNLLVDTSYLKVKKNKKVTLGKIMYPNTYIESINNNKINLVNNPLKLLNNQLNNNPLNIKFKNKIINKDKINENKIWTKSFKFIEDMGETVLDDKKKINKFIKYLKISSIKELKKIGKIIYKNIKINKNIKTLKKSDLRDLTEITKNIATIPYKIGYYGGDKLGDGYNYVNDKLNKFEKYTYKHSKLNKNLNLIKKIIYDNAEIKKNKQVINSISKKSLMELAMNLDKPIKKKENELIKFGTNLGKTYVNEISAGFKTNQMISDLNKKYGMNNDVKKYVDLKYKVNMNYINPINLYTNIKPINPYTNINPINDTYLYKYSNYLKQNNIDRIKLKKLKSKLPKKYLTELNKIYSISKTALGDMVDIALLNPIGISRKILVKTGIKLTENQVKNNIFKKATEKLFIDKDKIIKEIPLITKSSIKKFNFNKIKKNIFNDNKIENLNNTNKIKSIEKSFNNDLKNIQKNKKTTQLKKEYWDNLISNTKFTIYPEKLTNVPLISKFNNELKGILETGFLKKKLNLHSFNFKINKLKSKYERKLKYLNFKIKLKRSKSKFKRGIKLPKNIFNSIKSIDENTFKKLKHNFKSNLYNKTITIPNKIIQGINKTNRGMESIKETVKTGVIGAVRGSYISGKNTLLYDHITEKSLDWNNDTFKKYGLDRKELYQKYQKIENSRENILNPESFLDNPITSPKQKQTRKDLEKYLISKQIPYSERKKIMNSLYKLRIKNGIRDIVFHLSNEYNSESLGRAIFKKNFINKKISINNLNKKFRDKSGKIIGAVGIGEVHNAFLYDAITRGQELNTTNAIIYGLNLIITPKFAKNIDTHIKAGDIKQIRGLQNKYKNNKKFKKIINEMKSEFTYNIKQNPKIFKNNDKAYNKYFKSNDFKILKNTLKTQKEIKNSINKDIFKGKIQKYTAHTVGNTVDPYEYFGDRLTDFVHSKKKIYNNIGAKINHSTNKIKFISKGKYKINPKTIIFNPNLNNNLSNNNNKTNNTNTQDNKTNNTNTQDNKTDNKNTQDNKTETNIPSDTTTETNIPSDTTTETTVPSDTTTETNIPVEVQTETTIPINTNVFANRIFVPNLKFKEPKKQQVYSVFTKRFGKLIKLSNENLPKNLAKFKAGSEVDTTPYINFILKPAGMKYTQDLKKDNSFINKKFKYNDKTKMYVEKFLYRNDSFKEKQKFGLNPLEKVSLKNKIKFNKIYINNSVKQFKRKLKYNLKKPLMNSIINPYNKTKKKLNIFKDKEQFLNQVLFKTPKNVYNKLTKKTKKWKRLRDSKGVYINNRNQINFKSLYKPKQLKKHNIDFSSNNNSSIMKQILKNKNRRKYSV